MPSIFSLVGDLLKKKPDVPGLAKIDPNAETAEAIQGNINNLPQIRELADLVNRYSQQQFETFLPKGAKGQIESNILSALKGEVPDDVSQQVQRRGAEFASAGGFGGSIFGRNLTLRDLGLTSLQRSDMGLDMAAKWLSFQPPQFNFGSMFVSPEMQLAQANADRSAIFQRKWMENQLDAAYNPWTLVGENTIKYDEQMSSWADMAVASYLGQSAGGGGGGGGAMMPSSSMGGVSGSSAGLVAGQGAPAAAAAFSDRNMKKNIESINEDGLADALANLEVTQWHYKTEADYAPKHIGPMAQDFNPIVGKNAPMIEFQDAIGVLLAAVKSLSKRVKELEGA